MIDVAKGSEGTRIAVVFEEGRSGSRIVAAAAAAGISRHGATPAMLGLPPLDASEQGGGDTGSNGGLDPATLRAYGACDATIVVATPSFGRPSGEMTAFLDQAATFVLAPLASGRVVGIVIASAEQGTGYDFTLQALVSNFLGLGLLVVGPQGAIDEERRAALTREVRDLSGGVDASDEDADPDTMLRAYLVGERVCANAIGMRDAVD